MDAPLALDRPRWDLSGLQPEDHHGDPVAQPFAGLGICLAVVTGGQGILQSIVQGFHYTGEKSCIEDLRLLGYRKFFHDPDWQLPEC